MQKEKSRQHEAVFGYGIASTIYGLIVLMDKLPSLETIRKSVKRRIDIVGTMFAYNIKKIS